MENTMKNETMKIHIKSIYSDDNNSLDGYFVVSVPEAYKETFEAIISETGKVLDDIKNGYVDGLNDIDFDNFKVVDKNFIAGIWNRLIEYPEEGTSLEYILDILGWDYEKQEKLKRVPIIFDADYNQFIY